MQEDKYRQLHVDFELTNNINSAWRISNVLRGERSTTIYHEYPFITKVNYQVIQGYIDFISIDEEITIIDFKSDYVDNENILIERYTPQLNAYKLAIESLFKDKKVNTYIYSFSLNKMIQL